MTNKEVVMLQKKTGKWINVKVMYDRNEIYTELDTGRLFCYVCNKYFDTSNEVQEHIKTKNHMKKLIAYKL